MKNHNLAIAIIMLCVAGLAILALQLGCNKPKVEQPTPVQIIEQTHNPKIDSLKKFAFMLIDSIGKLNSELAKQKNKTAIAESKATSTADKLSDAIKKKDTVQIIVYAEDVIDELYNYRKETMFQDSIQDGIIEKQAAVIVSNRAEIELHESKYNLLKEAHAVQSTYLAQVQMELVKNNKKLKRAKFLNKVLGITTAAGAVLAGVVFL